MLLQFLFFIQFYFLSFFSLYTADPMFYKLHRLQRPGNSMGRVSQPNHLRYKEHLRQTILDQFLYYRYITNNNNVKAEHRKHVSIYSGEVNQGSADTCSVSLCQILSPDNVTPSILPTCFNKMLHSCEKSISIYAQVSLMSNNKGILIKRFDGDHAFLVRICSSLSVVSNLCILMFIPHWIIWLYGCSNALFIFILLVSIVIRLYKRFLSSWYYI